MNNTATNKIILALFFLSGMVALILEVIWMRQLTLIFGTTLYAISTVLAIFMAGLALGSFIFSRIVDKSNSPLRLYAFLEGGIGIYVLISPLIFSLLSGAQLYFAQNYSVDFSGLSLIRLVLSFLALLIPTTLMGGTLPVVTKYFVQSKDVVGGKVGFLYAINTLGGVVGAIIVGYILIKVIGVFGALLFASGISLIIATTSFLISRKTSKNKANLAVLKNPEKVRLDKATIAVLIAVGFSGFASLSLEVLWSRVFSMILGSSIYAFSIVLSSFLFGLALGSFIMSTFIKRIKNYFLWFAILFIGTGISIIALTPLFGHLPYLFLKFFQLTGGGFGAMQFYEYLLSFVVILIPTILMGAIFPIAAKIVTPSIDTIGRSIGDMYFANTVGATLGPLVAGFVLIPVLGLEFSIILSAIIYLALAVYFFVFHYTARLSMKILVVSLVVVISIVGFFVPTWDKNILNSAVYTYAHIYKDQDINSKVLDNEIIYYKDGLSATVAVEKTRENDLFLTINGKGDAGTALDMDTQLIVGHLPMLLHDNPKSVLLIGLGSGISLGALEQYDELETIYAVEIEPSVVEAASYFGEFNNNALEDSRLNMEVADGRNYVLTSSETYDVIIAEPSNPWTSGNANLFTKEQFEIYRDKLNDGGIMFQWAHIYKLQPDDVKTIVATFQEVFPHTVVWQNSTGRDIFLIGSEESLKIDFEQLKEKMSREKVKIDLKKANIENPEVLLSYSILSEVGVKEYSKGAKLHTDNYPILEINAPKSVFLDPRFTETMNLVELEKNRTNIFEILADIHDEKIEKEIAVQALARTYVMQGEIMFSRGDYFEDGANEYEKALSVSPRDINVTERLVDIYIEAGDAYITSQLFNDAEKLYSKAILWKNDNSDLYIKLARSFVAQGKGDDAIQGYEKARDIEPLNLETRQELGVLYGKKGLNDKAKEEFLIIITYDESNYFAHNNLANVYRIEGNIYESISLYKKSLSINQNQPEIAELLNNLQR